MSRSVFHPDLRIARFLPRTVVTPRIIRLTRALTSRLSPPKAPAQGSIVRIDGTVSVRVFRPAPAPHPVPALLWIHGGGYVTGAASMADRWCRQVTQTLGVVTAAVDYRLAPEHPFPAPLDDCYAALRWLAEQPDVDPARIAIGGESAGGGLAAALTLLAKERAEVHPVLQVLSYPMLDDRTTTRTDVDPHALRMWNQNSNRFGWRAYLGPAAGDVPPLAAPARYDDLTGLPPTWIGVGTRDLFHDEDVAYAERLKQAGVPTTLHVVPGAYHAFDLIESYANISRTYRQAQTTALRDALIGNDQTQAGA